MELTLAHQLGGCPVPGLSGQSPGYGFGLKDSGRKRSRSTRSDFPLDSPKGTTSPHWARSARSLAAVGYSKILKLVWLLTLPNTAPLSTVPIQVSFHFRL